MSANHSAELEALAQVAPVKKGMRIFRSETQMREAISEQIASMVVRQFHVALLRAASNTRAEIVYGQTAASGAELLCLDDEIADLSLSLPKEVNLWLSVIIQALHDYLCGREGTPAATQALRDEAGRYFWSRTRQCLVRHCLLTGLMPAYVRQLAGMAEDFVSEHAEKEVADAKQRQLTTMMSRAERLRRLVGDA